MREAFKRRFPAKQFLRNVGVLMVGTVGAHTITVAAMPVITRLYSPQDFSILAVYASILAILLTLATLSLHIGVPIAESQRKALSLMALSGAVLISGSVLIALVIWMGDGLIIVWLRRPDFGPYLWMVVPGFLLGGGYLAVQMWFSRQHEFSLIARTRVARSIGGSGTQLAMGFAAAGPIGLVVGHMLYNGLGVVVLLRRLGQTQGAALRNLSTADLSDGLRKNQRYIFFTTPENLVNMAAVHLPVIAIAAAPAAGEAGHLYMAQQIMTLPMMLVGSSVGQVFLAEAPQRYRNGELFPFVLRVLRGLSITGVPVLVVLGVLSPYLAAPILGENWKFTGTLIAWMTPWILLQFLAAPLSTLFYVVEQQALAMWVQIVGLILRLGSVLAALVLYPAWAMQVYAVASAFAYLFMLGMIYMIVWRNK